MESTKNIIAELRQLFEENANPEFAKGMKDYMRGKYTFYGIKMGPRRKIAKHVFDEAKKLSREELIDCVKDLYREEKHEMHHMAVEFLEKNLKGKKLLEEDIALFEQMVLQHSWWDTVDMIAGKLMGRYFLKFPEKQNETIDKWITSDNIWLIRCAILFQLKYKEKTDLDYLFDVILRTCHTDEFFINKAIGWILRENSKRVPDVIEKFVESNKHRLSDLSIKEGIRLLK